MSETAVNVQLAVAAGATAAAAAPPWQRRFRRAWLGRALREPFLHFIVLGGLLFAFNEWLEARSAFTRITVTRDDIAGIITNYQLQYGYAPTGDQLQSLIDQFVREEVYYHEALRLGLDKGDEIIRRRLVQKYEFLQQDLAVAHLPSPLELRAYYREHQARYRIPDKLSFSQVFFSTDTRGEQGARADAERLRVRLLTSGASRAPASGDSFPGPTDFAAVTPQDVARVFGAGTLAEGLLHQAPGSWSQPVRSGLGWHLIHLDAIEPAHAPAFEEVEEQVRRDYLEALRQQHNDEAFAKLKRGFTIVRE